MRFFGFFETSETSFFLSWYYR